MKFEIPFRSEDDHISTIGTEARHIDDPVQREVVRELVGWAATNGAETVGEMLERFEALAPTERREIVDRAREAAGQPSVGAVEAAEASQVFQATTQGLLERDEAGMAWQLCAVCGAQPTDDATGAPMKVAATRWHCEAHIDQAGPHDMEPWTAGLRFGPSGALEFGPQVERERAEARDREERLRKRREEEEAERAPEVERLAVTKQAERDRLRRETPEGFPVP